MIWLEHRKVFLGTFLNRLMGKSLCLIKGNTDSLKPDTVYLCLGFINSQRGCHGWVKRNSLQLMSESSSGSDHIKRQFVWVDHFFLMQDYLQLFTSWSYGNCTFTAIFTNYIQQFLFVFSTNHNLQKHVFEFNHSAGIK